MVFLRTEFLNILLSLALIFGGGFLIFFKKNPKINDLSKNYIEIKSVNWFKKITLFVTILLVSLANLGPVLGNLSIKQSGINIVFVVDTSKSMGVNDIEATNVKISRLTFAREIMKDFVLKNPQNNYSLISFTKNATILSPLTDNQEITMNLLDSLEVSNKNPGTNLEEAVLSSTKRFDNREEKAIILLSDGGDKEDMIDFEKIKSNLENKNVVLFTVGIGTKEGGKIPEGTGLFGEINYKKYDGEDVISNLNSDNLKKLASIGNGKYIEATNLESLNKLRGNLESIGKYALKILVYKENNDWGRYFIVMAFILFLTGILANDKIILKKKYVQ
ncbi:MAG: VWA domain-containing protein [Candidatus Gracilibacteria bacterium]|nr:VWA domain-containing protein [Candidatus Gracilibacteria bacterium]MDD3120528.1 VWA domain-containing protein [Candidatus Gracilibacteria bacterium]MDD4530878.1 VWA domain-containing protein [Candidatus Gracilibacteria bacterium]